MCTVLGSKTLEMVQQWSTQSRAIINCLNQFIQPSRIDRLRSILDKRSKNVAVVLENIGDEHNAAACIRTTEGMGIQNIHVVERFETFKFGSGPTKGAHNWCTMHRYRDSQSCVRELKEQGYQIVGTSLGENVVPLEHLPNVISVDKPVAIVFGNENRGISKVMSRDADALVSVPMRGFTQSYNVSVTVGLTLYGLDFLGWIVPNLNDEEKEEILALWCIREVRQAHTILKRFGVEVDDL